MEKINYVLKKIASKYPSSKRLTFGTFEDIGMIATSNDTLWGWLHCYSSSVEKFVASKKLKWAYCFRRVENDYPDVAMFIGEGNIVSKAERCIGQTSMKDLVSFERGHFKDVCDGYNEAFGSDFEQHFMGIADTVLEVIDA